MLLLLSVACICLCGIGGFWFLLAAGQVEQDTVSKFQSQKKTGKTATARYMVIDICIIQALLCPEKALEKTAGVGQPQTRHSPKP